jgi:predicted outer membrane protein
MPLQQSKMMTAAALATLLLAGCAGSNDQTASLLVTPGKYAIYNCGQLAVAAGKTAERERELEGLMAKAQTGAGGQVEARDKHCTLPPDAAAAPQPQALPPPPKGPRS